MHLLCGTCPHVHPVAIQTCKVLFIVFIREATRACPSILPALLAALPKSSLGSGIVHRTWAKAQWSQRVIFYWSKPLNWSSTGKANWANLLSTHQNNIWISLCCLFYFLWSFFLESELFVQTDFPSVYLLVFLITVIWGGGRWARGRNQGKTMVNWALFNTPTEKKGVNIKLL